MKYVKIALNILLTIGVMLLAYELYAIINEPIQFEKEKKVREKVVIQKLKDIREAQLTYREVHGKFTDNWNKLIHAIKNDSIMEVKIIGNPDDTTQGTYYDTLYQPILTELFSKDYPIGQIRYIPFSEGEEFQLKSDQILVNRVKIPVFKASAPDKQWLKGLNPKYIDPTHALTVGSLTEARYTGNWE